MHRTILRMAMLDLKISLSLFAFQIKVTTQGNPNSTDATDINQVTVASDVLEPGTGDARSNGWSLCGCLLLFEGMWRRCRAWHDLLSSPCACVCSNSRYFFRWSWCCRRRLCCDVSAAIRRSPISGIFGASEACWRAKTMKIFLCLFAFRFIAVCNGETVDTITSESLGSCCLVWNRTGASGLPTCLQGLDTVQEHIRGVLETSVSSQV